MNPERTHPMQPSLDIASGDHDHGLDATLSRALSQALSQAPELRIPADFATRTAARVATQAHPRPSRWIGWGPRLALGSGGLLTLALFALAPHAAPTLSSFRCDAELLLFAELGALLLFVPKLLQQD